MSEQYIKCLGLILWDVSRIRMVASCRRFGTCRVLDCLNLEDDADMLSRNVGQPIVTPHKTEGISAPHWKPGVSQLLQLTGVTSIKKPVIKTLRA